MEAGLPGQSGQPAMFAVVEDGRNVPGPVPTQLLSMVGPFVRECQCRKLPALLFVLVRYAQTPFSLLTHRHYSAAVNLSIEPSFPKLPSPKFGAFVQNANAELSAIARTGVKYLCLGEYVFF